ncbi:MAG: zinc ribbon domain-containing protein [Clostridia bacterium]|nr:zinc ribbon domain-containing protein [Clostridia bacterium]
MKKLDKNAYQEKRYDKGHLTIVGLVIAILALAGLVGGIVLFVNGCIVSGIWATIWRIVLGLVLVLLGGSFGWVAIMILATANSMIKVKDGNVSDVGNSAMGTVNINKCSKCGEKLEDEAEFCHKCGAEVDGYLRCDCGAKNKVDAEFCIKCGKKLNNK